MAKNNITNPDHPNHPLHGLANERKARENAEIKTRQRCAVCRNYWPWCECSTGSQIAQLLAPGVKEHIGDD